MTGPAGCCRATVPSVCEGEEHDAPSAWKVTRKATRKFCRQKNDCLIDWETNIEQVYRGTVKWNGLRCKVTYGWELIRAKCRKGQRIVIWRAGVEQARVSC